jgi:hypothetical protein
MLVQVHKLPRIAWRHRGARFFLFQATLEVNAVRQDGVLVYVKPMLLGNEPPDVESYAAENNCFRHQTTANQGRWLERRRVG